MSEAALDLGSASRYKGLKPQATWRYVWSLLKFRPRYYTLMIVLRIFIFGVGGQLVGLITRTFFNELTSKAPLRFGPAALAAMLVAVALVRAGVIFTDIALDVHWWFSSSALLRKNLFERLLDLPGARSLPYSPGEAISRFRGDVEETVNFLGQVAFIPGYLAFAIVAFVVMLRINARITAIVFLPMLVVLVVSNLAVSALQRYHRANRKAAGAVSSFIGEMFGSVQAIKVATSEERMIEHFALLNEKRRVAALKDRLFHELLHAVFWNAVNLGTGLILMLAGQAMRAGTFSVGDFALFTYYVAWVTELIGMAGVLIADYKQMAVAFERQEELMQGAPAGSLVKHGPVYMSGKLPDLPRLAKGSEHRLERLSVRGLSYHYPGADRGIQDISFDLERGSFTVITGRIGSGKTTLLRVLLGLLRRDAGEVFWNGEPISDPGSFLVPPRCAYTPQSPRLFSESLQDNILMGLPPEHYDVAEAIREAVMEEDLEQMKDGLRTLVGPKGMRLSGGQQQRCAAARMFVRNAELLVFDDLSSALDVETERQLWERLFARQDATCLVVSHRRVALRRADQVIVLRDGRVEAKGSLDELLYSCEEMQRLWRGDLDNANAG